MTHDLQNIISFWRDCIKSEQALDQSFGVKNDLDLTSRTKAMLLPGRVDPFIFANPTISLPPAGEPMKALVKRPETRGEELYYGYPLLAYRDNNKRQLRVAPLFIIQLEYIDKTLQVAEPYPTMGAKAADILGLKSEEAAALNAELVKVFENKLPTIVQDVFTILEKEVSLQYAEPIDPIALDIRRAFNGIDEGSLYNRAILFTAETAAYNLHLLKDLDDLTKRHDFKDTALNYLVYENSEGKDTQTTPIMPFMYDPYQLDGIQTILGSKSTVITGPPGTGKSQFIANLIVNLFLQRKKVLFVSHTNEAVRVVNKRVGEHFKHMIMQTGRKDVREGLSHQLDEIVREFNEQPSSETVRLIDIERVWNLIKEHSLYLKSTSELAREVEYAAKNYDHYQSRSGIINLVKKLFAGWRLKQKLALLEKREDSADIEQKLQSLRHEHVDLSRHYVTGKYLTDIVRSRSYGKLVAYVQSVQQRKSLAKYQQYNPGENYMDEALGAMNVWSCTLKSLGANFPLKPGIFDYVIFDEASQIDLPSAAPALYRAKRLVVVGDKNQLTHISKINEAVELELAEKHSVPDLAHVSYRTVSLFSSTQRRLNGIEKTLLGHYRANPLIARVFNTVFYGSGLKIFTNTDSPLPTTVKAGVFWIDIKGEARKHSSGSRDNEAEIEKVVRLYGELRSRVSPDLIIGITSPYSRQTHRIADAIEQRYGTDSLNNTKVLTVHKFQGSEVDILLFSTVISSHGDGGSSIWYKNNPQIINVAISRAKHLLLIVGDEEYALNSHTSLADIAQAIRTPLAIAEASSSQASNYFEMKLLTELRRYAPASMQIAPQYLVDGQYTVDIALLDSATHIAVEVDGSQHELVGDMALFDDEQRDKYLKKKGWEVERVSASEIVKNASKIAEEITSRYTPQSE